MRAVRPLLASPSLFVVGDLIKRAIARLRDCAIPRFPDSPIPRFPDSPIPDRRFKIPRFPDRRFPISRFAMPDWRFAIAILPINARRYRIARLRIKDSNMPIATLLCPPCGTMTSA